MNFEDAFKHYQDGTATEEERDYVEGELAKAKAFSPLLDDEGLNVTPAPLAAADISTVKKAKKSYKLHRLSLVLSSILLSLVVIATILSAVFGSASAYANKNIIYGKTESIGAAKECALNFFIDNDGVYDNASFITSVDDFRVDDVNKDFHYNASKIELSYYAYRVELHAAGYEIVIEVDTRNIKNCQIDSIK